ncbi:MAG: class I SAM-dependent methyltransferase [Saprospiraceae bacterium]|nr:class I SAM-dependent methyltransferase [Saprospiraceae bacterium]
MAYDFHTDKERYFNFQYEHSHDFIVPFVNEHLDFEKSPKVLEVGSAEAGVLKAFTDLGVQCTGIEISESRVEHAKHFMKVELEKGLINFIAEDIYKIDPEKLPFKYDLIILKDVIEHIHDQKKVINFLRQFLNEDGFIFFTMPPWKMPFGGHQQICVSFLKKVPYIHLLPRALYKMLLLAFKEPKPTIDNLLETWDTGISIRRFEKISKETGYSISKRILYLINPTYKYKFNLEPKEQIKILRSIPWLRDFFTTSVYYLIQKNKLVSGLRFKV